MKRFTALGLAMGLIGCDNVDAGLVFEKFVAPDEDNCTISPDGEGVFGVQFDPMFQGDLNMFPVLANTMQPEGAEILTGSDNEWAANTTVRITGFDHSFVCDDSLFSGAPPMFLPLLGSSDVPFCADPRNSSASSQGFDVRPVDAAVITPGTRSAVAIKVITGELGRGFEEMFQIATSIEGCCSVANDPACFDGSNIPNTPECQIYSDAFASGRLPPNEIDTVRAYAKFDFTNPSGWVGSGYTMKIVGNITGQSAGGRTLTSNAGSFEVELIPNRIRTPFTDPNVTEEQRTAILEAFQCFSGFLP